jgi:hypothetical protein
MNMANVINQTHTFAFGFISPSEVILYDMNVAKRSPLIHAVGIGPMLTVMSATMTSRMTKFPPLFTLSSLM